VILGRLAAAAALTTFAAPSLASSGAGLVAAGHVVLVGR